MLELLPKTTLPGTETPSFIVWKNEEAEWVELSQHTTPEKAIADAEKRMDKIAETFTVRYKTRETTIKYWEGETVDFAVTIH